MYLIPNSGQQVIRISVIQSLVLVASLDKSTNQLRSVVKNHLGLTRRNKKKVISNIQISRHSGSCVRNVSGRTRNVKRARSVYFGRNIKTGENVRVRRHDTENNTWNRFTEILKTQNRAHTQLNNSYNYTYLLSIRIQVI